MGVWWGRTGEHTRAQGWASFDSRVWETIYFLGCNLKMPFDTFKATQFKRQSSKNAKGIGESSQRAGSKVWFLSLPWEVR